MIWSGGMAWIADFPDPSNFYGPILGCARGGRRLELGEVLQRGAGREGGRRRRDGRSGEGRRAGRAPGARSTRRHGRRAWVPVFNEKRYTMRSARMGGDDALYIDPGQHPDELPLRRDQVRCARLATTRSTAGSITSAGTTRSNRRCAWRRRDHRVECRDSSAGQLTPDSTVESVTALDFSKINPVSGPISSRAPSPATR